MDQHNIRQGTVAAPEVLSANKERNRIITAQAQQPRLRKCTLDLECFSCQVKSFLSQKV